MANKLDSQQHMLN